MGKKSHVLAIPLPAQGHVIPMMELAQQLASNGIKVTFVNTEFNHGRVMEALSSIHQLIDLVSVPDGLESWEDRHDQAKLAETTTKVMPGKLESLIKNINETQNEAITCVLADFYMGEALKVAQKFSIKRAAFMPGSMLMLAVSINAQKLLDKGIVDNNGTPVENGTIRLSPSMHRISTTSFPWTRLPDLATQQCIFHSIIENNKSALKLAEQIICNSSYALEPEAVSFVPDCQPIGPLLASSRLGKSSGSFWLEDSTCLEWLDRQAINSVVYVAFGSFTVFDVIQFQELALGLELTDRPFLLVVREDIMRNTGEEMFPVGFKERVKNQGKMVDWAPQQQVLSHPSVACFLSHCGWNSIAECVSNAVPILCWPYFADQFLNQSYVVEHWGVGLGLDKDEKGTVRKEEITNKVEQVLNDECFKTRALTLRGKVMAGVGDGGESSKNFHRFLDWIKEL